MNGESTVIAFEKLQSRQKEAAKHSSNKIFVQSRSMFIDAVAERLGRFFAALDDELFSLSEKADNCVRQAQYFNDMRYLRCKRDGVREQYLRELTAFFEAFWRARPLPDLGLASTGGGLGELALLENEILEERLAINGMVEKCNILFQKDLYALDKRFMALLGKPEAAIEVNPVSPLVLCRLFAAAGRRGFADVVGGFVARHLGAWLDEPDANRPAEFWLRIFERWDASRGQRPRRDAGLLGIGQRLESQ